MSSDFAGSCTEYTGIRAHPLEPRSDRDGHSLATVVKQLKFAVVAKNTDKIVQFFRIACLGLLCF